MSQDSDSWSKCGEWSQSGRYSTSGGRQKQHSLKSYSTDDSFESFTSELTTVTPKYQRARAPQVPSWTVEEVYNWVKSIDFERYVCKFAEQMVDGDMLLLLTEEDLKTEIGMISGLHRTRFLRSLQILKMETDYSEQDETDLNGFLKALSPELATYTYRMLTKGIDRRSVMKLTERMLEKDIGMSNAIHRLKLLQAIRPDEVVKPKYGSPVKYDVFICYRRGSGAHLAALIKLVLELRGYRIYFDIDVPNPGKFDSSFLENVLDSKHILVILSPNALDQVDETLLHKELRCAFDHHKNVIPIFDPSFGFPSEDQIPTDIRLVKELNGISWIGEYQDACVAKCVKFMQENANLEFIKEKYNLNNGKRKSDESSQKINQLQRELTKMRSQLTETNRKLEEEKKKNQGSPRRTPIYSSDGSFDFYSDTSS